MNNQIIKSKCQLCGRLGSLQCNWEQMHQMPRKSNTQTSCKEESSFSDPPTLLSATYGGGIR